MNPYWIIIISLGLKFSKSGFRGYLNIPTQLSHQQLGGGFVPTQGNYLAHGISNLTNLIYPIR